MENSDAELKGFSTTKKSENTLPLLSPDVTVNQLYYVNPHPDGFIPNCCTGSAHFCQKIPCMAEQVNQVFKQPACAAQHKGLKQHGDRGATPTQMNFDPVDMRQECCCWKCGPNQCGTTEPKNTGASRDEDKCQLLKDEYLEPPLPLRSDEDWQLYSPFVPPHYMYNYNLYRTTDVRHYQSAGNVENYFNPVNRSPLQPCHSAPNQHRRPRDEPQNWFSCSGNVINVSPQRSVSVNVPHFVIPPVGGMSPASVMNPSSPGAEVSVSCPHEQRRAISIPDVCRNVFVTYSSDVSSEIVAFIDFLTKQGFRPTTDIIDNHIRHIDISKWRDRFLLDPSALIIIAISPKYKVDIEGSAVDGHNLYTRYIHTMMQNEFIQQGSLNFRFIPVLFLNASQKHVPSWLQNTHIYRWPQDTEDLLLRLLREEKYVPPPVPVELTLIIRPVASSSTATL